MDEFGRVVAQPIEDLKSLLEWIPPRLQLNCPENYHKHCYDRLRARTLSLNMETKVLLCHDMNGGYLDDRFVQGCSRNPDAYSFTHWHLIDTFIYFSHHFITIPPLGWINAAHRHGVSILGTIITEWDDGSKLCKLMLESPKMIEDVTSKLAHIALFFGFDGWLINIENKVEVQQIPLLKTFVQQLTDKCHAQFPHATVLWYDSVTVAGELKWQDELNDHNEVFFNLCDGIFLNYCTTKEKLSRSRIKAESNSRQKDVYVGIDVFGRGTPGGGGFNCKEVVEMIAREGLSCAIFAPGWVMEHLGSDNFYENDIKFWGILSDVLRTRPSPLPFSTSFCQGFGDQYFLHGEVESNSSWFNLNLQSAQLSFTQSQFESYTITKQHKLTHSDQASNDQEKEVLCSSDASEEVIQTQCSGNEECVTASSNPRIEVSPSLQNDDHKSCCETAIDAVDVDISVTAEEKHELSKPCMSFDTTCGYKGGGCLRLETLSMPDMRPVVFKLFDICGTECLRQLEVTWKCTEDKACEFVLMLTSSQTDDVFESAVVLFVPPHQIPLDDRFCKWLSQPAVVINPNTSYQSQSAWKTRRYDVDFGSLPSATANGDMILSLVLLPLSSKQNVCVDGQPMCLWLGEFKALTDECLSDESHSLPPSIHNMQCVEIPAQSLSSLDIGRIVMDTCFNRSSPARYNSNAVVTKDDHHGKTLHTRPKGSLFSSHMPVGSVLSFNDSVLREAVSHPVIRMRLKKIKLDSDYSYSGSKCNNKNIYILQWETSSSDLINCFLVYLIGRDQSKKTFIGFTSSNSFVFHADSNTSNPCFYILPVTL